MSDLKVIDVARYQGIIDWEKVRKDKIDAAIIQCGYGSNLKKQDDVRWERNVSECERLGIPWAPYLFSYADNMNRAYSEVAHMLRCLEGHNPTFGIVYTDVEETSCGAYAVENAKIFAAGIKKAGYTPGLYTYESYFNRFLKGYKGMPLWIAKYSNNRPQIGVTYDGWQYTSSGSVSGITGRVDMSVFWKDYRTQKATKPKNSGTAEAIPEITYQVKTGHHGTGALVHGQSGADAGIMNDCIVAIKIGVTAGRVEYRVHLLKQGWLPKVTGCSWTDYANGYAGDGHSTIDALQVYYYSEDGGKFAVKYQVQLPNGCWLPEVTDTNFEKTDGNRTAGIFGQPFTALKMRLEEV